jgi:ferric-dicitrate binding protein FerR (iron transport regulator)
MAANEHIKDLLQRYKDGSCSKEEIRLLEQWFERVQENSITEITLSETDEERLAQRFKTSIQPAHKERKPFLLWRRSRIAAAIWVGVLLLSGYTVWKLNQSKSSGYAAQEPAFREVRTTAGQHIRIILPDSSVVWLNSNSTLSYHPDFSAQRQLRLAGEAFFEVKPDKEHPFIVATNAITTTVYGTAFNISARKGTGELKVALQHGSIGVLDHSTGKENLLVPGQLLAYNQQTRSSRIGTTDIADIGAWRSGKLIFDNVPLKEVMSEIERQYKVTCIYYPHARNPFITARFDNASLQKVMDHIAFGWQIQFKRTGDTLYVK